MMLKTHLAIALFFAFAFLQFVNNKIVFFITCLIASLLPDIDTEFSMIGKYKFAKLIRFFTQHRGVIHSFTLSFLISLMLAGLPFTVTLSFGFFLGYSTHLVADSFTKEGITPFWPYKRKIHWRIKTNSLLETGIFISFIIIDMIMAAVILG